MSRGRTSPPRWMDRIVEWYCRADLLEDLQGDLHEYYSRNVQKGRFRADLIFALDVIKFCRPYTIQKPKFLGRMTFFYLFNNYFKTSVRSFFRNKLFSSINVIGLSVAMSIGILMITYLSYLLSFDEFHEKKERVYKLGTNYRNLPDGDPRDLSSTSVWIGDKMEEAFTGIEKVLIMQGHAVKDFTYKEKTLQLNGKYASEAFFEVFSFPLVSGDPETALKDPYTVVLTETAARKFFMDENPVGKVFESGEDSYEVTGVMEDPPKNTHLGEFDMLVSFATSRKGSRISSWRSVWMYHVYVLLEVPNNEKAIGQQLARVSEEENATRDGYKIDFELVNLSDITPGTGRYNAIGIAIAWEDIHKLLVLTMIILISSCFNYTNLSIARSLRRAREVGIRKVVGAKFGEVFTQFIFEAVLISLISLVFAYVIFLVIKPGFENEVLDQENIKLVFKATDMLYYVLIAIVIGWVAGIAPALVLSRLKANSILRSISAVRLFKGVTLRKVLIVFQFSASMALIIAATISYRQYLFSINHDYGYRTENILNIDLTQGYVNIDLLKTELEKIPEIKAIGTSMMLPGTGSIWGSYLAYKGDSIFVFHNNVDAEYLKIHDIKYLAGDGEWVVRKDSLGFMVIDEKAREKLGFMTAEEAIGEIVTNLDDGWKFQITGVMDGYEYMSIEDAMEPSILQQNYNDQINHANLLVQSNNLVALMDKLETAWKLVDTVHPLKAEFYDVQIQQRYAEYRTMYRLFVFLASLAVLISTMGLFGIAVFTTETRQKEIGIRKVLGASPANLIRLLSKGFVVMLLTASAIAMPVAYYLFDQHVLTDFRERISIGWVELTPGIAIILIISMLTIGWQTLKAARENPVESLRDE